MDLEILKIASDTKNNKNIENHSHFSKLKNPLCGDEIQIKLVIKKDKIVNFGYQEKSCIYCQASASLLSKISTNKSKNKINKLCDHANLFFEGNEIIREQKYNLIKKLFNKNHFQRKECILLPFKALKKLLKS